MLSLIWLFHCLGASIYDVCSGWGRGGESPKSRQKEQNQLISLCYNGERGQKIPKFCVRHIWKPPWAAANWEEIAEQLGNIEELQEYSQQNVISDDHGHSVNCSRSVCEFFCLQTWPKIERNEPCGTESAVNWHTSTE